MNEALPTATQAAASEQPTAEQLAATQALTDKNRAIDQADDDPAKTAEVVEAKPEKTHEQREIDRLRRGIDRKTRQLAEARTRLALTAEHKEPNNQPSADDSEPLSLTRAQLREMVNAQAQKLAPTLQEQATEVQRRQSVVTSLAKTWGQDKFDSLADSLDAAFDGLTDKPNGAGKPKPATDAVFEADDPAKVIEYLANPEHDDEAEAISRMSASQAGKAIAKLEAKLALAKPQASKAPAPLEAVKGSGPAKKSLVDLQGADFDKRRREQIAQRR